MILEAIVTLLLAIVVYIAVKYAIHLSQLKRYPPGPIPLPLIGNLHLLGRKSHLSLKALSKTYGDVMSVSFGTQRVVIINSTQAAREVLLTKGEDTAGRPQDAYPVSLLTNGYQDIVFSDYGPKLKLMRKIAHEALKMYGTGMEHLEECLLIEIGKLFNRLDEVCNTPFDPKDDIALGILNIICAIVFGKRYEIEDEEFRTVVEIDHRLAKSADFTGAIMFIPWLRFLPNEQFSCFKKGVAMRDEFLHKKLQEHRETFDENNIRDFTDSLLKQFAKEESEDSKIRKYMDETNLEQIVSDLFLAGSETTTNSLHWALLYFATWPKVQAKIADERKQRIGNRQPRLRDRGNLPYFEATIQEIFRLSSIVLLIPHKTIRETKIDGHAIPKGTQILINLWALHHDEREWDEPTEFKPERFLDADGNFVHGMKKSLLPFGAGRRGCLGESLAKMEIFMFLSSILYRYEIHQPEGEEPADLEGIISIFNSPKPYKIQLKKRDLIN
eukprot:Seg1056.8 transcript_id=Seg1056.8/GoldUCD/mRNA.D3Y31 product="Steroid 17-alpha-hydroxylase/17 20 lyase" protein_id=Seg1056.8/GoldUCD/D3Y31